MLLIYEPLTALHTNPATGHWKVGMASILFYQVIACAQVYSARYSKAHSTSVTHMEI